MLSFEQIMEHKWKLEETYYGFRQHFLYFFYVHEKWPMSQDAQWRDKGPQVVTEAQY